MTKLTVEQAKERVDKARRELANSSPAMKRVAVMLDSWVQRNFNSDGGNVGGWAPFKYGGRLSVKGKSTGKSVEAGRYINASAKLLRDTGQLRLSFLPFASKARAGIGSDLPYAEVHENGSRKTNIPQRRMLPRQSDRVFADIAEVLDNFVVVRLEGITE